MIATQSDIKEEIKTIQHSKGMTVEQQREDALADQREALLIKQAERIATLQSEISVRQEELDSLKARIAEEHPEPGSYPAGAFKVIVKQGRRSLDAKRFMAEYPAAQNPRLYELKPKSLTNVAKLVGELAVEELIVRSKPSVVVE